MRGHIRQGRPGVWWIWVDLGPDPVTGKRRQRTQTIHGTEAEQARSI